MVNKRIAQRYSKAIFDLAKEQGILEEVKKDMTYLESLTKIKAFNNAIISPVIPIHKKLAICDELLNKNVNKMTAAFVSLIIRKKRSYTLPAIASEFVEMYNLYKKILPVEFYTAVPIDKSVRDQIIKKIKEQTQSEEVILNENINDELIGGFVMRYEDKLYDASIKHHINELRKELI